MTIVHAQVLVVITHLRGHGGCQRVANVWLTCCYCVATACAQVVAKIKTTRTDGGLGRHGHFKRMSDEADSVVPPAPPRPAPPSPARPSPTCSERAKRALKP